MIPADAHMVPKPDRPLCFAPQGTDSILSNIALGATFFFFGPALRGAAEASARATITKDLIFILPPLRKLTAEQKIVCRKAVSRAFLPAMFNYCFGGFGASAGLVASGVVVLTVPVVLVVPVVPVVAPVLVLLLNCCEAFRKLFGSFASWL